MQDRDELPVEPPSPTAIARGLCSLVNDLEPDVNSERVALQEAGRYLAQEPPDVEAALKELDEAHAHSFRDNCRETRPEVWLVAASIKVLRG